MQLKTPLVCRRRPRPDAVAGRAVRADAAAPKVTSPKQFFGHDIGADYVLPNYTKFTEYVKKLDAESDRMIVQSIGKTAEGRDQLMAIITAPENHKNLRSTRTSRAASRWPRASPTTRRARWPATARPWCGSTAACTPPKCSARSS